MIRSLLTTLLLLLALAAPAQAHVTADSDEAPRWQAVEDQAAQHVPVPPWVQVKEQPCPVHPESRGCYDGYTIWMTDPSERTFRHELGHAADFWVLHPWDRTAYEQLVPQAGTAWLGGPYGVPTAGEWFAETYEDCSLDPANPRAGEHAYGYNVTPEQHRAVCAYLDRIVHPPVYVAPPAAPATTPLKRHKVCVRKRHHHKKCRWVVDKTRPVK